MVYVVEEVKDVVLAVRSALVVSIVGIDVAGRTTWVGVGAGFVRLLIDRAGHAKIRSVGSVA